jgi:hypothetical protein
MVVVLSFLTVTVVPETAAPSGAVTVPTIVPTVPWAHRCGAPKTSMLRRIAKKENWSMNLLESEAVLRGCKIPEYEYSRIGTSIWVMNRK